MKFVPSLDKNFKPFILELKKFEKAVENTENTKISIYIERTNGYNYIHEMKIFKDDSMIEENYRIVERVVKALLWIVGGFKIGIYGSHSIYEKLKDDYKINGDHHFDADFMARVYEKDFVVEYLDTLPELKLENKAFEPKLNGCRIGFDAGGSDRKVSAVKDGEVLYSEETIWLPKLNSDPNYHYQGILESMKKAASFLPRVDSIGVSSAGVYIDNKIMVASLFLKVNEEDFDKHVKNMYIDIAKEFGDVPLVVANDGDVTALAGAMDLGEGSILGIAMGTSEAVGFVDSNKQLKGWLNELAFAPVDFNKETIVDEWSHDYGVGCKYFSQDSVIKLAEAANIEFKEGLSLAEKLKYIQKLNDQGNEKANEIFENIGIYLGYTLAYYHRFYNMKHVLLLGRVVSGRGGNTILDFANNVLQSEFPELNINVMMPDEASRRVGQSIAAASMPEVL